MTRRAVLEPQTVVVALACALALAPAWSPARSHGQAVNFVAECMPGQRLTVAAVGDLLFHPEIEAHAQTPGGYRALWTSVAKVLAEADITYGNLEGPVTDLPLASRMWAGPRQQSDLTPLNFNYRPSLIDDLKAAGFTVVSTANNHALDRGSAGVDRTVENLEKRGLAFSGTRKRAETQRSWSVVTSARGLNIAWLACTYGTNGIPDLRQQVLSCFRQQAEVLAEIARLSADPSIHAVIFAPHWGIENSHVIEQRQRDLARAAVEAGAVAIIGTHPHVLQPWEKRATKDGREALVIYSTGNFISAQREPKQRTGMILLLEFVKPAHAARARLSAARYVLTWIDLSGVPHVSENTDAGPFNPLPAANRVRLADAPLRSQCCSDDAAAQCRAHVR